MATESSQDSSPMEGIDSSYIPMIHDANQILDTLSKVWRYCLAALLLSLSAVGAAAIGLYLINTAQEQFFVEGIIYLAIAAWVFARNLLLGSRNSCCTEDIPRWKDRLASFVKSDNTVDAERDGESIIENLMKVTSATADWIRTIKRDVFSVLFWPVVAVAFFLLSVYQANFVEVRVVEVAFVVYIVVLAVAVYFGVNAKFRRWQAKADSFRAYTSKAIDNL